MKDDRPQLTLFDYKPFSLEFLESKSDEDLFNLGAVAEIGTEILKKRGYSDAYIRNEYVKRANPFMLSYMRGTEYNDRKNQGIRNDITYPQNGEKLKTSEVVAEEYSVSKNTIERDAQLTNAIDTIAETAPKLKAEILQGESGLTKQEVLEVAKEPELIKAVAETPKEERKQDGTFHISNKNNDWYTPLKYIDAARTVMGSIDTDPASSELAQQTVQATKFYTQETNGLLAEWSGNVWMNPPYSMPEIQNFIDKLLNSDGVNEWIVLTNNSSDTSWFHKLLNCADLICFTKGRINFTDITGTQGMATRQGQTFFYKGDNHKTFTQNFSKFGAIVEVLHEYAS